MSSWNLLIDWETGRRIRNIGSIVYCAGAVHSHVLEISFGLLFTGLRHQEIEFSNLRIGFDFLVPLLLAFSGQPEKNLRELFTRKTLDLCLERAYF